MFWVIFFSVRRDCIEFLRRTIHAKSRYTQLYFLITSQNPSSKTVFKKRQHFKQNSKKCTRRPFNDRYANTPCYYALGTEDGHRLHLKDDNGSSLLGTSAHLWSADIGYGKLSKWNIPEAEQLRCASQQHTL